MDGGIDIGFSVHGVCFLNFLSMVPVLRFDTTPTNDDDEAFEM